MINVYCDGSFEPPGIVGVGAWGEDKGKTIFEIAKSMPEIPRLLSSCNVAEFEAIAAALERLKELKMNRRKITIHSDSQLAVYILQGIWKSSGHGVYGGSLLKCRRLLEAFNRVVLKWIPREQNCHADVLSKRFCKVVVYRKSQKRDGPGIGKTLSDVLDVEYQGLVRSL